MVMLVLAAIPSASVALVVTRSATHGFSNGIAVALGIVLADLVFVALAILGLGFLAETLGSFFITLRYLGGAYLIWLGIRLLRSPGGMNLSPAGPNRFSLFASFTSGFLLTLGDVKAILFYATIILTAVALISFAANSVLCRIALGGEFIDPVSFTTVRLVGGALVLLVLSFLGGKFGKPAESGKTGTWRSGFALFAYALAFSLAYVSLPSGTGALILFGVVQITMLLVAMHKGERMKSHQWLGFAAAGGGLLYLLTPGISAPDPFGALLMAASGIAWSYYTLAGKGTGSPVAITTGNFARAALIALPVGIFFISRIRIDASGFLLALSSGVVTSGLGYVIWYRALPLLTTTQAAILQLLVPLLATLGGVLFISEQFTTRLAISGTFILGGVAISIRRRRKSPTVQESSCPDIYKP
eukprot:g4053.t1